MSTRPRLRRRTATIPLLLAGLTAWAGCSNGTGPGTDAPAPITALPRALTVAETEVVDRSTAFGIELLSRSVAADARPNVVLSPLSASMALGMTLNGAAGGTFDAMRATLGFDAMTRDEVNTAYAGLIKLLVDLDPAVDFTIANAIWANAGVPVLPSFTDRVREAFSARIETADFGDPATLDAINGWADEATAGLIPQVLETLDPELLMILMNAIYFEGRWTAGFDPADTHPGSFRRSDGATVQVPMMRSSDREVRLASGAGWSAVELPYGGGAFGMVIILPDDELAVFLAGWSADDWSALVGGLTERKVDALAVPRFTIEHDAFLNPVLADMGMGVAFGRGADFSELVEGGGPCIDFVRQKTFIEVDEVGTKAAAVTTVGVGPTSLGPTFIVDRPFVFAIHERLSGSLLFTGAIGDPALRDAGEAEGEGGCH